MFSHYDLIPTFCAAAGEADVVAKCLKGHQAGNKTFKVHLDGYNLIPFFKGEAKDSPRKEFLYWSDDGDLLAIRYENWKIVFLEQRSKGLSVWREPFSQMRIPKLFNLRSDPFERGEESTLFYDKWFADHAFIQVPIQGLAARWLETFKEFPIRQKPASFNLERVIEKLMPKN